jgi:hypothetical protein
MTERRPRKRIYHQLLQTSRISRCKPRHQSKFLLVVATILPHSIPLGQTRTIDYNEAIICERSAMSSDFPGRLTSTRKLLSPKRFLSICSSLLRLTHDVGKTCSFQLEPYTVEQVESVNEGDSADSTPQV